MIHFFKMYVVIYFDYSVPKKLWICQWSFNYQLLASPSYSVIPYFTVRNRKTRTFLWDVWKEKKMQISPEKLSLLPYFIVFVTFKGHNVSTSSKYTADRLFSIKDIFTHSHISQLNILGGIQCIFIFIWTQRIQFEL